MKHSSQSGSIIIWVLVAVALFAALTAATVDNFRGSAETVTSDGDRLEQYGVKEYENAIATAVQRLKLRGCADDQISYETPSGADANVNAPEDGRCHVFRPSGGQVTYRPPATP